MKETRLPSDPIADFRTAAIAKGEGVGLPVSRDHALHAQMSGAVAILRSRDDQGLAALKELQAIPRPMFDNGRLLSY
jgi:hypothetical protein